MLCIHCGAEVIDNAKLCSKCGLIQSLVLILLRSLIRQNLLNKYMDDIRIELRDGTSL